MNPLHDIDGNKVVWAVMLGGEEFHPAPSPNAKINYGVGGKVYLLMLVQVCSRIVCLHAFM